MLFIGEKVGAAQGDGPEDRHRARSARGHHHHRQGRPNALAVLAIAEEGCLLNAPDVYMEKLAIGPGYPEGVIDLASSRPTISAPSPRPRASARPRSSSACSTGRATRP